MRLRHHAGAPVSARARRALVIAATAAAVACASPAPPPGGPPDALAPRLLQVTPDTGAVGVRPRRVTFQFDEVVNERPAAAGTLDALFLVSPRDGEPDVKWERDAVTVRPHRGFRANTVYVITMLPGLGDLRGNVRKDGATAVFSTGPTIPDTRVDGLAFDWVAQRPLQKAFVEAVATDSVTYVTAADSLGRFTFRHLPIASYRVRAYSDINANRYFEAREAWDSATVAVRPGRLSDTLGVPTVELLAFTHDTIGPRIAAVTVRDSVTLAIDFDKGLLPSRPLTVGAFRLRAADSTAVTLLSLRPAAEAEAARRRESEARRDTTLRADSIDRARRADSSRVANADRRPLPPEVVAVAPRRDSTVADSAARPRPSRPAPPIAFELRLATPLVPGTAYRLAVADVANLLGRTRSSDRVFSTPKAPPPPSPTTPPRGVVRPVQAAPVPPPVRRP